MLQGTFGNFKLADVLHLLAETGRSGALRVWGHGESRAYIRDGELSTVVANGRVVPLAECLRSRGLLSDEQVSQALADARSADLLGSHLLETGLVDPGHLRPLLRTVFDDAMFGLLRRAHTQFHFQTLDDIPEGVAVPVDEALQEGWRRVAVWETLRARIPCAEAVPSLAPEPPTDDEQVKVPRDEWHRLSLIDGHRSLEQLAQHGCEGELETFLAVDRLVRAGLVVVHDPVEERDDPLAKPVGIQPEILRFPDVEPAHPGSAVDPADIVRELAALGRPGHKWAGSQP
ncbi:MAG: DUF4388 domain-containing protein [Actinomycetota bacterium]|nr:DUF4388 domain-containing protein [Actinomycetota bacterium]